MPEHDPPCTERLALYMCDHATEKPARDEPVRVIERWNQHLASDPDIWWWSPTISTATVAGMPWLDPRD